jgi:hypothetical protein
MLQTNSLPQLEYSVLNPGSGSRARICDEGHGVMVKTIALFGLIVWGATAFAQGTPRERAACRADYHRHCRQITDVFAVLTCLQAQRTKLKPACRKVLEVHGL